MNIETSDDMSRRLAKEHLDYLASDEFGHIARRIGSVDVTLADYLKFIETELVEAMDSLEPEAPKNGRTIDGWHASAAVLRAWVFLTKIAPGLVKTEARSTALAAALRTLVEGMDRSGGDGYGMPECPWCHAQETRDGDEHWHQADCELAAARALTTEQPKKEEDKSHARGGTMGDPHASRTAYRNSGDR